MSDLCGQSIGRYHLIEKLGMGGMAVVYRAFDSNLECDVAIKLIRMEKLTLENNSKALARFKIEAQNTARLLHPNIVPVMDYGEFNGIPYLVMRYIPAGRTLKSLMGKPIPYPEAIKIISPIASALATAHASRIIHRDVKPSNILLTSENIPMLTDFGIAKILDLDDTQSGLTATGMAIGTPEYMAPEQWEGKPVDGWADVYALGVVFYELVTGRPPFKADTVPATMVQVLRDPLPRPTLFVPSLPPMVERFLLKALARDPAYRYQTMNEVIAALGNMQTGYVDTSRFQSQPPSFIPSIAIDDKATFDENATINQPAISPLVYPYPKQTPVYPTPPGKSRWWIGLVVAVGSLTIIIAIIALLKQGQNPSAGVATSITNTPQVMLAPEVTSIPSTNVMPEPTQSLGIGSVDISRIDGMEMVYVPAGDFLMGSPDGVGESDEHPLHTVYLDAYWIDKTEVTNGMYEKCVSAGACTEPLSTVSISHDPYYGNPAYEDYPVIYVTFSQAVNYCNWAGRSLPTEAQWEKAARGNDGRNYPWGNETPTGSLTNFNYSLGDPSEVGSYPAGASPYEALDMAGNVWEWVADLYDADYYSYSPYANPTGAASGVHFLRGGSWGNKASAILSANRNTGDETPADAYSGFRCAIDAE